MRIYVILIVTSIILSFSTAYFAFNLSQKELASHSQTQEIIALKKRFEKMAKPELRLDLSQMYPSQDYFALLHPLNVFQKEASFKNTFFTQPCLSKNEHEKNKKMTMFSSAKSEMWEDFRCFRIKNLPANFFEKFPLIHESGVSFAYLAYLSGKEPFNQVDWIKGKLNYFHISELSDVPEENLEKNFYILSRLSGIDRDSLIKGYDFLITEDAFLLKESKDASVSYKVYNRNSFDHYLKTFNYKVKSYQFGRSCFYRDGRFCIEIEDDSVISLFKRSTLVIFTASLFILIMICYVLYMKIRQQKIEEERKKHALSVLTHELRTPIANLLLQIESINRHSDDLSEHLLEDFLKIEGEIYRLKRLTEKSTSYLNSLAGKELIVFDKKIIPSINEIHERFLESYVMRGVELELLKVDTSIHLDIYWWHMCVKNLVENALNHGKAPIKVKLQYQNDELMLNVFDSGEAPFDKLSDYLNKKNMVRSSEGLGIGLSLVHKIMKEMKGELLYFPRPKTFILKIKDKNEKTNFNHRR